MHELGGNLPRLRLRSLVSGPSGRWKLVLGRMKNINTSNITTSNNHHHQHFLFLHFTRFLPSHERGIGAVGYLGTRRDEQDALFHHQAHINSAELYTVIASIPRASAQIAAQTRHTQPILSPPDKVKL